MHDIDPEKAIMSLHREGTLEGFHVRGRLDLLSMAGSKGIVKLPIRISDCTIEEYYSPTVCYTAPVEWVHCKFRRIELHAVYFLKGLVCRDTEFLSEISYGSGGHNSPDTTILFERVKFNKFVDFFDCWFRGPVVFRNVEFLEGTNLLNEEHGWVSFDVPPVLEEVSGPVDFPGNLESKNGAWVISRRSPRQLPR